jgi:hypothetical protein
MPSRQPKAAEIVKEAVEKWCSEPISPECDSDRPAAAVVDLETFRRPEDASPARHEAKGEISEPSAAEF